MQDGANRTAPAGSNIAKITRSFVDADSVRWQVYEKEFSSFDRRSGSSLIFASEGAVRRVRGFPANWHTLSDAELAELSWQR